MEGQNVRKSKKNFKLFLKTNKIFSATLQVISLHSSRCSFQNIKFFSSNLQCVFRCLPEKQKTYLEY